MQEDYEYVWPRLTEDQQEKRVNVRVKFGPALWDRLVSWQDYVCVLLWLGLVASTQQALALHALCCLQWQPTLALCPGIS